MTATELAPPWIAGRDGTDDPDDATTWRPIALADVRARMSEPERPTVLQRSDGLALLYPRRIHWIHGESEACKTWVTLIAAAQVLDAGGRVAFIDYEDDAVGFIERLDALGIDQATTDDPDRVMYVRPEEGVSSGDRMTRGWFDLAPLLDWDPTLVILDGVAEGMDLEQLDPLSNSDVVRWMRLLPRRLATTGAAVIAIDHVTKSTEGRGRHAIGGIHKLNGIDGAAYTATSIKPFGRAWHEPVEALVRISVAKDRRGWVRGRVGDHGTAAEVTLTSWPDGGVTYSIDPPGKAGGMGEHEQRVAEQLWRYPGTAKRDLRALGNADAIDRAIAGMIDRGEVEVTRSGAAHRHDLTDLGRTTWPDPRTVAEIQDDEA